MSTAEHTRPLLSVRQAAERLGVSEPTIRRLINSGVLPAVKVGPHVRSPLRIDPDELDVYVYGPGDAA